MKSDIITDVEKYKKGWHGGLPETPCGFGSKMDQTGPQRAWIPRMVEKYNIRSIVDVGAGDLNWMRHIKWPHEVEYTPLDLVPRHESVKPFDLLQAIPPQADLVMCLWVLNHFPEEQAKIGLDNLLASKPKYIMYTWWPAMFPFLDLGYDEVVVMRERKRPELRLVKC